MSELAFFSRDGLATWIKSATFALPKSANMTRIQLEVDFIASLGSKKYYVRSALPIPDREKKIQESRSLMSIDDSFKKIIIVKDHIMPRRNEEGILTIGLFDFLLKENSLDL